MADLASGSAVVGAFGTNRLFGIENLAGTSDNDELAGNDGANVLTGNQGGDYLRGRSGADRFDYYDAEDDSTTNAPDHI